MAISITKQLYVAGKHANIDATYGPYDTTQHAIQSIPREIREVGLTVIVKDANGEGIEYWWKRGIEDADLTLKIDQADDDDLENTVINGVPVIREKTIKTYTPETYSGMGRVILRKNMVNGVNVLTQEMINQANTIYEIRYNFDLNKQTITIPDNCVLKFNGGMLTNGTINCNNCSIDADKNAHIFDLSIALNDVHYLSAKWFGAKGDLVNDDTEPLRKAMEQARCTVFIPVGRYKVTGTIDSFKNEETFDNNIAWIGEGLAEGRVWTEQQNTYGTSFHCIGDNDGDPFFYLPRFAENLTFMGELRTGYNFGNGIYAKYENSIGVSLGKPAVWASHGRYRNISSCFFGIGLRCENSFGCEFYSIFLSRNFKGLDFSIGTIEGKDSGYITIIAFYEVKITDNVIAGVYADFYTDNKGIVRAGRLMKGTFNGGYIESNNIREDITDYQGNPVKCQVYSRRYGHYYFNDVGSESSDFCYGKQEVYFHLVNCRVYGNLRTSYGYLHLIDTMASNLISDGFNNIFICNSSLESLSKQNNDVVTLINIKINDVSVNSEIPNLDLEGKKYFYTLSYTISENEQALYLIPTSNPDVATTNIKVCLETSIVDNVILDINSNLYGSDGGQHAYNPRPRVNVYNNMADQSYVPYRVNTHFIQNDQTSWQRRPVIVIPLKNNNNELIQSCTIKVTSEIPLSCEVQELGYTENEYIFGYTYLLPQNSDNNNYYECIGGYVVGTTEQKPVDNPYGQGIGKIAKGQFYFDTTLNKPIWWTGSAWVDATGATV
jgi:hypothetical protein